MVRFGVKMDYEQFHIVANQSISNHIANVLRASGIRIEEQVSTTDGRTEWIILVHSADMNRAYEIFQADVGSGRTFASPKRD
jgi:hypothetical protein